MRALPSISLRLAGACAALVWIGMGCARGDITLPDVPPPQPSSVLTRVYAGESVDIPLAAFSRSGSGLQFAIRRQPRFGKLSPIRMTGKNTAVVTYTHDPTAGLVVDEFRFAVSAPGVGVSTPATVTVSVVERPAAFVAPARLDFPDVAVGHSLRQSLNIRNDGGGVIEGRLVVPAPWSIANGDGGYSLGPGESATFEITFSPTAARHYAATGEFSHAPGLELGLGGHGYEPIEVLPRVIRLEADGRNEARAGFVILRNISDDAIDLQIAAPPEIVVQDKIRLAAKSDAQITLQTRAGFLAALDGKLAVSGDGLTVEAPVQVAAAPARLVVKPEAVDFGSITVGRMERKKIVLTNAGGSPADIRTKLPAGIALDPDPGFQLLAPGASREYVISYSRPLRGKLNDTVIIEAGELGLRLPVSADVHEEQLQLGQTGSAMQAASEAPAVTYSEIPPVDQIGVTRQTKTELDLAWKRGSPNITKYVLFLRTFVFDDKGKVKFHYERLDRVKVRFIRQEARTSLAGLRSGESVTLIIVGFDSAGNATRPSLPFTVATKPSPVFHFPWFWLSALALAVLGVFIARERRRARVESDAAAMAKFEELKG